jgi:hypothetical protein
MPTKNDGEDRPREDRIMALIQEAEPAAPAQASRPALFSAHAVLTTMLCILFAIMYLIASTSRRLPHL